MRAMLSKIKRLLFLAFALTVFMSNLGVCAYNVKGANENYLRILVENAYIYSDINLTNKIFEVPYGYFVKVENNGDGIARVVYGEDGNNYPVIMGYMNSLELTEVIESPTKPFTVIKVSTEISDILFNDGELKKAYFNVPEETFMYYYGDYTSDTKNLCYVYCKNKLGYIDKSCLNPFTVPESPDKIYIEEPKDSNDNEDDKTTDKASPYIGENLQIIIIVGISVISISVVYFLFKPSKSKTTTEYQENSDDE